MSNRQPRPSTERGTSKPNPRLWCGLGVLLLTLWATASHATLVGYWNFNEGSGQTVADRSGFGNTGTLGHQVGGGVDPQWVTGHTGAAGDSALNFDFTTSKGYVTVASASSLNVGSAGLNDALTISAWINIPTIDAATYDLLAKTSSNLPGNYEWGINRQVVQLGYNDVVSGLHFASYDGSANKIPGATWYPVAVVLQEDGAGSTSVSFYRNGVQFGTTQTAVGNFAQLNSAALLIGLRGDNNQAFKGAIDDVALWNHALNPAQLAQLAAGTRSVLEIIPEPSTLLLLGLGGWLLARRRASSGGTAKN